jgi:hypothetical protein
MHQTDADIKISYSKVEFGGFILRDAADAAPPAITAKPLRRDEVLDPHGEERGNAARLEPRGRGYAFVIPSRQNAL